MNRRGALAGLGAAGASLMTGGCGELIWGQSATIRFRTIAMAEVDGERVEGSAVMEIRYRFDGFRASSKFWAEAFPLELKGRGTVFVLPVALERGGGGSFVHAYDHRLLGLAGVKVGGPGAMTPDDYKLLRAFSGRKAYDTHRPGFPLMVGFRDEANPNSVFEVDPTNFAASFGPGVRLIGVDVEATTAPITKQIRQRLKWVTQANGGSCGFESDPPGQGRAMNVTPLNRKLGCAEFISEGLW